MDLKEKEELYYALLLAEKEIKNQEKNLKGEGYTDTYKEVLESLKTSKEFPESIPDKQFLRYKNYLIAKEDDKYYLSSLRETKKIKNANEILENFHDNEKVQKYIEKTPVSISFLEPEIKSAFEEIGVKYKKTMPFEEKLNILSASNTQISNIILNEYDIQKNTQLRSKRNKFTFNEAIDAINEIKEINEQINAILSSEELRIIKISHLKDIIKKFAPLKEELKNELLLTKEPLEYFNKSDTVKLVNKIPNDELTLYQEKLSNSILNNEDLLKEIKAEIETNNSLVIFASFNSLNEIKELLNANKERVEVKNDIHNNSKFGII